MSDRQKRMRIHRSTPQTNHAVDPLGPLIADQIRAEQGGGAPLPGSTRTNLEGLFDHNFANVRVHADEDADQLVRSVDAVAFTSQSDIFFRAGSYDPGSPAGMHLLAHELGHVIQQAGRPSRDADASDELTVSDPSDAAEHAADRAANEVMMGQEVNHSLLSGAGTLAGIQRKPVTQPLHFIPEGSVTFAADGWVRTSPNPFLPPSSRTDDFPGGIGQVEISAGTKAMVTMYMNVEISQLSFDGNVFNFMPKVKTNHKFAVHWNVTAAQDGTLTIDPPERGMPADGGATGDTDRVQAAASYDRDSGSGSGSGYTKIDFVVASAGRSDSSTTGAGVGIKIVDFSSEDTDTTNIPGHSLRKEFMLRIKVTNVPPPKEPTGTVTFGEVSALRTHELLFPRPVRGKGQHLVTSDESTRFSIWYSTLHEKTRERIMKGELAVELKAHTSTTGDVAYNDWLADERRKSVEQMLWRKAGRKVLIEPSLALGKLETPTPDQKESDEWRKVFISVFDVVTEGERAPITPSP